MKNFYLTTVFLAISIAAFTQTDTTLQIAKKDLTERKIEYEGLDSLYKVE